jgi:hypothetical protein
MQRYARLGYRLHLQFIPKSQSSIAICAAVLTLSDVVDADVPATRAAFDGGLRSERSADITPPPSTLRIRNVRLVAAPASVTQPSAVLKFEMANEGPQPVTDTLVEIVITEQQRGESEALNPKTIVGPVTIEGKNIIEAGYTLEYQMLLRNLSAECECVANVAVLSARAAVDADRSTLDPSRSRPVHGVRGTSRTR